MIYLYALFMTIFSLGTAMNCWYLIKQREKREDAIYCLCEEAEHILDIHKRFPIDEKHRPCETMSRVIFARRIMKAIEAT